MKQPQLSVDLAPHEQQLGKYRLIARLGQGGMGTVYLALASGLGSFRKLLVVKELRHDLPWRESSLSMFLDEAQLAARLDHPNVLQTFEAGEANGRYFLAMEYLDGQPLSALIDHTVPLELHVYILCEVLQGLQYAHELTDYDGSSLHVVHRDVSPQNVFVTHHGQVKIVDFGVAKANIGSNITSPGVFKGKFAYAAPEQLLGRPVDGRCDVFAVGVMLWEAIANRRFGVPKPTVDAFRVRTQGLEPKISQIAPDVDPLLAEICDHALAVDPLQRVESAEALRSRLQEWLHLQGEHIQAKQLAAFMHERFSEERAQRRRIIEHAMVDAGASQSTIAALPRELLERESGMSPRVEAETGSDHTSSSGISPSPRAHAHQPQPAAPVHFVQHPDEFREPAGVHQPGVHGQPAHFGATHEFGQHALGGAQLGQPMHGGAAHEFGAAAHGQTARLGAAPELGQHALGGAHPPAVHGQPAHFGPGLGRQPAAHGQPTQGAHEFGHQAVHGQLGHSGAPTHGQSAHFGQAGALGQGTLHGQAPQAAALHGQAPQQTHHFGQAAKAPGQPPQLGHGQTTEHLQAPLPHGHPHEFGQPPQHGQPAQAAAQRRDDAAPRLAPISPSLAYAQEAMAGPSPRREPKPPSRLSSAAVLVSVAVGVFLVTYQLSRRATEPNAAPRLHPAQDAASKPTITTRSPATNPPHASEPAHNPSAVNGPTPSPETTLPTDPGARSHHGSAATDPTHERARREGSTRDPLSRDARESRDGLSREARDPLYRDPAHGTLSRDSARGDSARDSFSRDSSRGDSARGDSARGDSARDSLSRDSSRGDSARDSARGDSARDSLSRDSARGDSARDSLSRDSSRGDSARGDSARDSLSRDSARGDSARDSLSRDSSRGDSARGDSARDSARDSLSRDSSRGDSARATLPRDPARGDSAREARDLTTRDSAHATLPRDSARGDASRDAARGDSARESGREGARDPASRHSAGRDGVGSASTSVAPAASTREPRGDAATGVSTPRGAAAVPPPAAAGISKLTVRDFNIVTEGDPASKGKAARTPAERAPAASGKPRTGAAPRGDQGMGTDLRQFRSNGTSRIDTEDPYK